MFVLTVLVAVADVETMLGTIVDSFEPLFPIAVLVDNLFVDAAVGTHGCCGCRACGGDGCLQFSNLVLQYCPVRVVSVSFLHE